MPSVVDFLRDFFPVRSREPSARPGADRAASIQTFQPVGLQDFLALEVPPREILLAPILPERSLSMLYALEVSGNFIDDGRVCLTNNAAERALRGFALGRKSWLFAGSERGADRAAAMTTLIMTAKLNDIDPQAGSPMCSPASTISSSTGWTNFCRGTGPPRWSVVKWQHER